MLKPDAADHPQESARLAPLTAADLPRLEQLVQPYYAEDGHQFHEDRQRAALAALAAGEPFGRAWLIEQDGAAGMRRIFLEVQRHNRVIGLYRRAGYIDHDRFLLSKRLM